MMHTVFLSEPVLYKQLEKNEQANLEDDCSLIVDEELKLLTYFGKRHPDAHFDRLPSCPLCLEKLDTTVTGLQQIPKVGG
jgi:hypothetical protein